MVNIVVFILVMLVILVAIPLIEVVRWWRLWHKSVCMLPQKQPWSRALVFLTGISDFSDPHLSVRQKSFVAKLQPLLNTDLNLATPFPYNSNICEQYTKINIVQRLFGSPLPMWVCSLHNFWQTVLSILLKKRYGHSVARCLQASLGDCNSSQTIFFVCGSAGAAIALAAIPYLTENTTPKIVVISYGGIFCFHRGSLKVTHHFQFVGEKDVWVRMWCFVMWPWQNKFHKVTVRDHRYSFHCSGPHYHFGEHGYLSLVVESGTNKTYQQLTLEQICAQISLVEEKR